MFNCGIGKETPRINLDFSGSGNPSKKCGCHAEPVPKGKDGDRIPEEIVSITFD